MIDGDVRAVVVNLSGLLLVAVGIGIIGVGINGCIVDAVEQLIVNEV